MIALINLKKHHKILEKEIELAVSRVVSSGSYILGNECLLFEKEFARYCGVKYCISVASGYDAILLTLDALGIKENDEVIVPAFTFISTVLPILRLGAKPVLVDVKSSDCNINVSQIEKKITDKTKAIIPVHLYGFPADMEGINKIASKYNLFVIEDAAQAHGSMYHNQRTGSLGSASCFSFYPTKNLGALGDGGAITTNSKKIAEKTRILRNIGQIKKNVHILQGYNSRLDEIHGAILRIKLKYLDKWNERRRRIALFYRSNIINKAITMLEQNNDIISNYSLFVIKVRQRNKFQKYLALNGIESGIHYPSPIHLHPCLKSLGYKKGDFPQSEELSKSVLSLPVYQELSQAQIKQIVNVINKYK